MKLEASFRLVRSKRKTLGICVYPSGEIVIRAPERMSREEIWRLVETKAEWIGRKLAELKEEEGNLEEAAPKHKYFPGEVFLYLGGQLVLETREEGKKRPEAFLEEDRLVIFGGDGKPEQRRRVLESWYRKAASQYIGQRIAYYAEQIGEYPENIRIKEQKRRWGSCSSKRNLNFNWRLIMAPPEIVDYVVVHELCHLKHLNHSLEFWQLVERFLPDYKERKQWLFENGKYLRW